MSLALGKLGNTDKILYFSECFRKLSLTSIDFFLLFRIMVEIAWV